MMSQLNMQYVHCKIKAMMETYVLDVTVKNLGK